MAISDMTRQYWIETVLGWAEDRLLPPQFYECKEALTHGQHDAEQLNRLVKSELEPLIGPQLGVAHAISWAAAKIKGEHDRAEGLLGEVNEWSARARAAEAELERLTNGAK
jgi:hypothetical protein